MKKLCVLILIVLIISAFLTYGKTIVPFPGLSNPDYLAADKNMIYITEAATIKGFSLRNYKKVLEFGKEGEGPGEFKLSRNKKGLIVYPVGDRIFVGSIGKVSFWSKKGKLIKEIALKSGSAFAKYLPYKDSFVGMVVSHKARKNDLSLDLNINDKNFDKLKTILNLKILKKGRLEFPVTRPTFAIWKNQIFVPNLKELEISVYNLDKEELKYIRSKHIPEPVSDNYKSKIDEFLRTSPLTRSRYEMFRKIVTFPKNFPPIQNMWVDNDKVYILTFTKKDNEYKFIIFNVNGEIVGETYKEVFFENITRIYPMIVKNGYIYQLNENQKTEKWELQINEIK